MLLSSARVLFDCALQSEVGIVLDADVVAGCLFAWLVIPADGIGKLFYHFY